MIFLYNRNNEPDCLAISTYEVIMIVTSFIGICVLLFLGKWIRTQIPILQRLYLPASVIGGVIGLVALQIIGSSDFAVGWTAGWSKLPGFLINIVFASLFLGVAIPSLSRSWKIAGPQLAYGQIVVWGQYVVGLGLTLALLKPIWKLPDLFGVVIPVGFEGGHGTAGGLKDTFANFDWKSGTDLCLASATAGIILAVIIGIALINVAKRRNWLEATGTDIVTGGDGIYPKNQRPIAGYETVSADSVDSLALHLAMIGIAVLIGWLIKQGMLFIEGAVPVLSENKIFQGFPLFPLSMVGGLIVQTLSSKSNRFDVIDSGLSKRLAGLALDFLVVAAIATIRIEVITNNLVPFLIIVLAGTLWNVFCVLFMAPRWFADSWFERAIAEMGQSMGVTATGLLLLRAADPENKTNAAQAFAYKQLLHEPFMGGGLWTSSAIPLIVLFGGFPVLLISLGAIVVWLVVWFLFFRKLRIAPSVN